MKHDSMIFDDETIDAAITLSTTDERTRQTREAIARRETPPLVGALTANDLLRWIENAERRHK